VQITLTISEISLLLRALDTHKQTKTIWNTRREQEKSAELEQKLDGVINQTYPAYKGKHEN
jgi:hypothetical protein